VPSIAVLFATASSADGVPAAALKCGESTLLSRLLSQLADLGITRAVVLTRPHWEDDVRAAAAEPALALDVRGSTDVAEDLRSVAELAAGLREPLVLGTAAMLTHREALAGLLADPRVISGILTSTARAIGASEFRTRSERGRLVSAESPYHQVRKPNGRLLGVLKVDPRDQDALATAATRLAELAEPPAPPRWGEEFERKCKQWRLNMVQSSDERASIEVDDADGIALDGESEFALARRVALAREEALSLLVVGLVRSRVHLTNSYLRELYWARPLSQQAADTAVERLGSYDEDRVLLDSAVKGSDGFFTTFFVSPYSRYIARWAARRGWTPNAVTTLSMGLGVVAAVLFGTGTRAGLIAGALMLQLAFTFDCVDGQLARYTRTFSKLGGWLDSIFDRGKEYSCYAGLAVGALLGFGADVWMLAAAALGLQTIRHSVDFSFASARHQALAALPRLPLEQPQDKRVRVENADQPVEEVDQEEQEAGRRGLARFGSGAVRLSRTLERRSWMRWVKKILVLPIGERFALISITAAVWTPRVTFLALLIWGGAALTYQLTGKVLRSVA
jgi:hypothetical protein